MLETSDNAHNQIGSRLSEIADETRQSRVDVASVVHYRLDDVVAAGGDGACSGGLTLVTCKANNNESIVNNQVHRQKKTNKELK